MPESKPKRSAAARRKGVAVAPAPSIDYGQSRRMLAHPFTIFLSVWVSVTLLYMMHLSGLLHFDNSLLLEAIAFIVIPFALACLAVWFLISAPARVGRVAISPAAIEKLTRRLRAWFVVWLLISIVEIVYSRGLPILWLIRGGSQDYKDFGIKSVHGLANSLLLAIAISNLALYFITRNKRYLRIPAVAFVWSIMVVTRNMMVVFAIETALCWELFRGFRRRTLAVGLAAFLSLILVFGYVGDVRTGADKFRSLAEPSKDYPDWLPSGVLWVYVYMTTPINNLINTAETERPIYNPLFPNTTSKLFPTVVRNEIYGDQYDDAQSGNLVSEAFNVSTAYVGPFQDWGYTGVSLFSILMAGMATYFWSSYSLRGTLAYVVVGQCLVLSVFYNHLFYLPIITQVVWLYFFCDGAMGSLPKKAPKRARPSRPAAGAGSGQPLPQEPRGGGLLADTASS